MKNVKLDTIITTRNKFNSIYYDELLNHISHTGIMFFISRLGTWDKNYRQWIYNEKFS